jgi:hypothetical protein
MKKTVAIILVMVICFTMCACDPGSFSINREELNNVISVELVEYTNLNQKHFTSWVPNHFNKLLPFDSTNATTLEALPSEKIPDFLDAFSKTDILHKYYAYNSPKDVCIKLNYKNGNFLIIWADYTENRFAGYIGEYSSDGKVLSFWGSFSALSYYKDLVDQYFTYKLE